MAPQFLRKLTLAAAVVSLGAATGALAQPMPSTNPSGGPTPSKSATGGPTPSTSKAGGPTPGSGTMKDTGGAASPKGKAGASSLSAGDRKFVETAAKDNVAEVELGKVAQQKAQNAQVKEFAGRMVQDHGKASEEVKGLAANKGVQLPDQAAAVKKESDELNKKAADKFDREYMEKMVKDHKKDVKEFEKQAKNAKDADVRAWAAKTLPTLQEHLKMAEAAQAAVKGSAKKK